MKMKIPKDVKICPKCKRIFDKDNNYCPYEEEKIELLEVEFE